MEAAGGKALACVVDIRDEQQIGDAVQKAVDKFGGATNFTVFLKCTVYLGAVSVIYLFNLNYDCRD